MNLATLLTWGLLCGCWGRRDLSFFWTFELYESPAHLSNQCTHFSPSSLAPFSTSRTLHLFYVPLWVLAGCLGALMGWELQQVRTLSARTAALWHLLVRALEASAG